MKLAFRSQCAIAALLVVISAFSTAQAQTTSATPDPFVTQLTSSPEGFYSFVGDMSANGRFVVFESNGNLDTQNRRNADGNREIFLADYAQRRIFQLTDTRNVQKPSATPTPTPTPTPTATPTPSPGATPVPTPPPTPPDLTLVKIEISNNRPMISLEPALVAGKRIYTIVFSSNAPNPASFDGTDSAALVADGNQEIWIYRLPEIDDTFVLSTGNDIPLVPLTTGTFRQITDTPPSRPLRTGVFPPDILDDNRDATISDDGTTLAFISTRNGNALGTGNADLNPELFFCRSSDGFIPGANTTCVQATATADVFVAPKTYPAFQQTPSLSANGNVVLFSSTADLATPKTNNDSGVGVGNAEVYVADFTGSGLNNIRQVTKTKQETSGVNAGVNVVMLSPGRRLSRDGAYAAYESRAEDPLANNGTNAAFMAVFVTKVSEAALPTHIVGKRALEIPGDIIHFPVFTDYDSSLAPHALVFESALNFKTDGTFPAADQESTGLNPAPPTIIRPTQLFATQVPVTDTNTFARLTKNPVVGFASLMPPVASASSKRIAFTLGSVELGGGNADGSAEAFYLSTPTATADSPAALSFFTGASSMGPFSSANPNASPTPTPAPSPSPGDPAGLAPGELGIVLSTVGLANSDKEDPGADEGTRAPILPVELNGVSVSVNGAAAGLYFVGDSPAEGIRFVMPIGVSTGVATFVINNQGTGTPTVFRGFVQVVASQPDIFAVGTTAVACNVTDPIASSSGCMMSPFKVMSPVDSSGTLGPTVLELNVTGVRLALASETKVTFVNGTNTTDVTATAVRPNPKKFGFDLITIVLPASLAGTAPIDYKLIVTVTKTAGVFTSRSAATAPQVTIIP